MLIRIAPDMFTDKRFKCLTLSDVRNEIFRTQKFKTKYPWRNNFKDKLVAIPNSQQETKNYLIYYQTISSIIENGTVNKKTDGLFDLSRVDQKIIAFAITNKCTISSDDTDLIQFSAQEFSESFLGHITPLELINNWLRNKLITWDDTRQAYLEEWYSLGEPKQPEKEKKVFTKLTGYRYAGS